MTNCWNCLNMNLKFGFLFAIILVGVPGTGVSADTNGKVPTTSTSTKLSQADAIQGVLRVTNEVRRAHGLSDLKLESRLNSAAQWMADDMATNKYFAHTDSMGRGLGERVPTFGYDEFLSLRENLAAGHYSPEEVVKAWMDSPSHKVNLLCAKVTEIGIGYTSDIKSQYGRYWVQEFGLPNSIDLERRASLANSSPGKK